MIFKDIFGGSKGALAEYQRRGEESGVFTLSLTNVQDPFDPDPLWDRKYGGNSAIVEEATEDNDFRLQAAIDGCRDIKFVRDEAGRFREQTPVFTDVVVWIPEAKWRADALHGGLRIEALATNLALLHEKKFARSLPGDRDPNYVVMPDEGLGEHTIAFQFGLGVFVPGADDRLLGSVLLRAGREGEPQKLPDWSFWSSGAQVKRPVGVYAGQGSMLITPDRSGPVRAPVWFAEKSGNISVNLNAADSERVYADNDNIVVSETTVPEEDGDPFRWVLVDRRGGPDGSDVVVVEVTFVPEPATAMAVPPPEPEPEPEPEPDPVAPPVAAAKDPAAPAAGPRPPKKSRLAEKVLAAEARQAEQTGRPQPSAAAPRRTGFERFFESTGRSRGGETRLSQRYMLKLAGCALLRIDGEHRLPGLDEWCVWFDRDGMPVRERDGHRTDTGRCLALAATSGADTLFYRLPDEDGFKPVQVKPCALDTGGDLYLDLLEAPAPSVYHGLLLLPQEQSFPLSSDQFLLGRSDSSPQAAQPDLPMELLDHPDSLRWSDGGVRAGARLNSLNLSRRHVSLRLDGGRLEIGLAEGKVPVYVLDRDCNLLKMMRPGDSATLTMEPDEYFVVGSYLLRFHQERPMTMMSSDATMLRRAQQGA